MFTKKLYYRITTGTILLMFHSRQLQLFRERKPIFGLIYILSIIFVFHSVFVSFSNSSYMEQFATPEVIGSLYTIGSALAVIAFLFISRILRKVGNVRLVIGLALVEIVALLFMGIALSPAVTIVAFMTFLIVNPLIFLGIDIFSESLIGDNESSTGSKRGLTLTLMSVAAAAGPFLLGLIATDDITSLHTTYFISAGIFSLFIILVLIFFKHFHDPEYKEIKVLDSIRLYWDSPDMRYVLLAQFTLQVFFSWTVIYIPLYMATEIGLSWNLIGPIIGIGLLAYVIFEYPIGVLADRYFGEKEMMALGFVILALSSSWLAFIVSTSFVLWAGLMFINRFGASLVEVTCESYFFKHTDGTDANVMSFFRLTRPLGFMVGSLLGSATLLFLPFNLAFCVLGLVMATGAFYTHKLHDTK